MDLTKWKSWLDHPDRKFLAAKIPSAPRFDKDYFLEVHAATEAAFRKLILIGLRRNQVTYKNAQTFLMDHDDTPGRAITKGKFQNIFQTLYGNSWQSALNQNVTLNQCWDLWLDYTKHIRNHIAHGIRTYGNSEIETALAIDATMLAELDNVFKSIIGGSLYAHLSELSPRLPRGTANIDPLKLLSIKPRPPRPKTAAQTAQIQAAAIDGFK